MLSRLLKVLSIFLSTGIIVFAQPGWASLPIRPGDALTAKERAMENEDTMSPLFLTGGGMLSDEPMSLPVSYPRLQIGFEENELPADLVTFIGHFVDYIGARDASFISRFADPDIFLERDFGGLHELGSPTRILLAALRIDADRSPRMAEIGWQILHARIAEGGMHLHEDREATYCTGTLPIVEDPELVRSVIGDDDAEDWFHWSFVRGHHDVRERPAKNSAIIGSVEDELVFSLPGPMPDGNEDSELWGRIMMPDGRRGFLKPFMIQSLHPDSLCFARDAEGEWKIAGYIGGGD